MNEPNARPTKGAIPPPWAVEANAATPPTAPPPPWAVTEQAAPVEVQAEMPWEKPAAIPPAPVVAEAKSKREAVSPVLAIILEDNIPLPTVDRKTKKECPYPLAVMQVGQSFFDAIPTKKMALVVNAFMRKHTTVDAEGNKVKTMTFETRAAEKVVNGVIHSGCRVFRTA